MRFVSKQELQTILDKHQKWLNKEDGGEQADLSSVDLSYVNLSSVDLGYANLTSANLMMANLSSVDLGYADLTSANLIFADLTSSNLTSANLYAANVSNASLSCTNLLSFQFNKHAAYCTMDGNLTIGCYTYTLKHWKANYKTIGKEEKYSEEEISYYGNFISLCLKATKNYGKNK